jgi:hypothetical protein
VRMSSSLSSELSSQSRAPNPATFVRVALAGNGVNDAPAQTLHSEETDRTNELRCSESAVDVGVEFSIKKCGRLSSSETDYR